MPRLCCVAVHRHHGCTSLCCYTPYVTDARLFRTILLMGGKLGFGRLNNQHNFPSLSHIDFRIYVMCKEQHGGGVVSSATSHIKVCMRSLCLRRFPSTIQTPAVRLIGDFNCS